KAYGFDDNWQAPVNTMIQKVLVTPLPSGTTPLTLSSVQCQDRINEMEFYFPLKSITPQTLKTIFKTRAGVDISADFPQRIDKLSFPLAKGFMKGYIDLVLHAKGRYFLVDWKSNFLGSRLENYDRAALNQTMHNDYYILQYHLYTLALHRYLQSRVPGYRYETDFGGVFYIFIRGVDPDFGPDFGIYKDLPAADTIAALGRALIPGG
ncbi:MAG: exodeoxyribonuclease V subunit beta, partial [Proteobacteria bacterium]|nr:exodeoxyribonuclease V subunit beta [Pseudomonadota bacterium]